MRGLLGQVYTAYTKDTTKKVRILDMYLAAVLLTGIVQFAYCALVGTFPFNSFLAGFISTVGMFVLTGERARAGPGRRGRGRGHAGEQLAHHPAPSDLRGALLAAPSGLKRRKADPARPRVQSRCAYRSRRPSLPSASPNAPTQTTCSAASSSSS